jgi:hypothetical protein
MLFDSCVVSALTGDGEEIIFYSTIFRNPSAASIWPGARASELRTTCLSEVSTNVEFRIRNADVFPSRQSLSTSILLRLQELPKITDASESGTPDAHY